MKKLHVEKVQTKFAVERLHSFSTPPVEQQFIGALRVFLFFHNFFLYGSFF